MTCTIIVGFTRYFGEEEVSGADEFRYEAASVGQNGRLEQLDRVVAAIRKLPYPALLLLLGIGSALVYNLGAITGMAEDAGMRAMKIIFITLAIAVFLGSVFGIILIILNYRLRKAEMEYHYKNQVAEKLGLVILDDHTVVDSSGKLLVGGEKLGEAAPLLPEISQDPEIAERGLTDGLQQTVGPPAKPMNVDQFLSKESH